MKDLQQHQQQQQQQQQHGVIAHVGVRGLTNHSTRWR